MAKRHCPTDNIQDARVERGQSFLLKAQSSVGEFLDCRVEHTIADGACFLHAIQQQLNIDGGSFIWELAAAVLYHMVGTIEDWKGF